MLDNPIWHSLQTRHASLAISSGTAARYPADVAPFMAVSEESREAAGALLRITEPGDVLGILNRIPPLGPEWQLQKEIEIHQYVWPGDMRADPCAQAIPLDEEHIPAMLELTTLVYPAYFRSGTARLGAYFGCFEGPKLVAMAGIRMAMDGFQELSAICTHPEFRGLGLAAALTNHAVSHVQCRGEQAFLHTESFNAPAKALYEKLGFELARTLPFRVYQRR